MILVPPHVLNEIHALASNGKKIGAIKALRSNALRGKLDLRTAKWAVERLMHEAGIHNLPEALREGEAIASSPIIKSMTCDWGAGPFEVDLESMQMKALMDMQTIGLDSVRQVLHLIEILEAFSEGRKITVEPRPSEDTE